jgi:hypothetical protein
MRILDRSRTARWAADLIDVAAVFFAVGTAHLFVTLLGEHAHGAAMLTASGAILIAGALLRKRWARRRRPPVPRRHAALPDLLAIPARECMLMRVRTTLPDRPGTLAALSGRLAARNINILAIQIHPAEHGAVDELLVAVPREMTPDDLLATVTAGGGEQSEAIPADAHDLVDPATRALSIAHHAAAGRTTLGEAVHRLLDADLTTAPPSSGAHVATVHAASGEPHFLARRRPAFTPTEVSRAQSLIDLCESLSRR